jgi:hypothetical protein
MSKNTTGKHDKESLNLQYQTKCQGNKQSHSTGEAIAFLALKV